MLLCVLVVSSYVSYHVSCYTCDTFGRVSPAGIGTAPNSLSKGRSIIAARQPPNGPGN